MIADATQALARFEVKTLDSSTRTFEGYASTWDMDLGSDQIHKGAFAKTIREWKKRGNVIPLIDQHDYWTVRSVLGKLLDAKETDQGLWTKWQVTEGNDGDELMHRLRGGMVDGLSIGFEILNSDEELRDGQYIRHLRELKLHEVSVVIWGMNPNALIIGGSVKSIRSLLDRIDRDTLSTDDLKELRRTASRIGMLLRPVGDAKNSTPPPVATPPTTEGSGTEAEEDDATQEEEEQQETPPEEAPPPATADESQPEPVADGQKGKRAKDDGAASYAYSEALRLRLGKLTSTTDV